MVRVKSKVTIADRVTADISTTDKPSRASCNRAPTDAMIQAFEQFNRGEYWLQHETLEGVWRAETDTSIRNFYKGIIQIGVGFYHLTNRNYPGVMKVLARGIVYLKPYEPECYGVQVGRLIDEASGVYFQVKELGATLIGQVPLNDLPQVHWRRQATGMASP